jgi:hypothetical protein
MKCVPHSGTGIKGSNPTRGIDICLLLFCVGAVLVGSGLASADLPSKESYRLSVRFAISVLILDRTSPVEYEKNITIYALPKDLLPHFLSRPYYRVASFHYHLTSSRVCHVSITHCRKLISMALKWPPMP